LTIAGSVAQDGIKWVVYSVIGTILFRIWKTVNNWKPTSRKAEVTFWALSFVTIFALIAFASSMISAPKNASAIRGSVYRCQLITVPSIPNFFVAFNLRLTNPGKPSTAWGWSLRTTLPGKQQYEYLPFEIRDFQIGGRFGPNTDTNKIDFVISNDNYLPVQLLEKTVGPDRGAVGWIMFPVRNIPQSEITTGTKFTIELEQSDGSKRTIDHIWIQDK